MDTHFRPFYLVVVPLVVILCLVLSVGVYNIPAVNDRLSWRLEEGWVRFRSAINPPEKIEFVPQLDQQVNQIVKSTIEALTGTPTRTLSGAPAKTPTPNVPLTTATITPTPTISPTPLPERVSLPGVKYETQRGRWNYCGPANLSMAMTFWGWKGNRDIVGQAVKPNEKDDKNVMPYEMENFVETYTTDLAAIVRLGGDLDLLKRMIAAGYPVLVEKGYYETDANGNYSWLGHYQFATGYDDGVQSMIVQDTYLSGPDFYIKEDEFIRGWRSFDFLFLVVYPRTVEQEVMGLLGDWVDESWATRHALEIATRESTELSGVDQYFAWYNLGTSYNALNDYPQAAQAYDQAFLLYAQLPDDGLRPFRMVWYQTGPYFAYYYTGRYQDVLNLANTTFATIQERLVLEESLYWRGMAKIALGDTQGAIEDFLKSLEIHPGFEPTLEQLRLLGVEP